MQIEKVADQMGLEAAAALAGKLWPNHTCAELEEELRSHLQMGGVVFLAREAAELGFAQCGLRICFAIAVVMMSSRVHHAVGRRK